VGGKGKSDAQARASALGESIERYSGLFQGDEARIRASFTGLGTAAIHPNACMLFSERQIAERDRWNRSGSRYTQVPEPFDPGREIAWSPVFPLRGGRPRYLPTASCYYGYSRSHGERFAFADSNGCAAGMTKEEAVVQGLFELCERDATAMWWYNRVRRPGVDLASFGDPYYGELEAYYRSIHRSLWALDITNDLGVPTFVALSRRTDKAIEDIVFGLGAHLDPKIALLRAVTELNQFLPAVFQVTQEAEHYLWDAEGVRFWKTATLASDPYLAPDGSAPLRTLGDYRELEGGRVGEHSPTPSDLYDDIVSCARTLEARGLEVFLLDQTRPDAGLHVVRVIVPGLRHFWARFAPGRLYDVPVKLGWLPRALAEHELNPVSIFF
jgi:ribosomal protein S12 methylthiotransferase accessory factor